MRITNTHLYFWDGIYSQWYPTTFNEDGIEYLSAEHYMMAKKAKLFKQEDIYDKIISSTEPSYAKELGRAIPNFSDEVWDEYKLDIVTQGNYLKFSQNPKLRKSLLKHKDLIIVEASPTDKVWGIGLHYDDDRVLNKKRWKGKNELGNCIMKARKLILNEIGDLNG